MKECNLLAGVLTS